MQCLVLRGMVRLGTVWQSSDSGPASAPSSLSLGLLLACRCDKCRATAMEEEEEAAFRSNKANVEGGNDEEGSSVAGPASPADASGMKLGASSRASPERAMMLQSPASAAAASAAAATTSTTAMQANLLDTPEGELALLSSLIHCRPVGMHKHWSMMTILRSLESRLGTDRSMALRSEQVWAKLATIYDLKLLDEDVRASSSDVCISSTLAALD